MIVILAVPAVLYLFVLAWTWRQTTRPGPHPPDAPRAGLNAACLVAARNEERRIADCLDALSRQSVPLDILVIDDQSGDRTADLARNMGFRVVSGGPGKALALEAGLRSTGARVILTTDADCRPPPGWAEAMVDTLRRRGLAALGGCTLVRSYGLLSRLEALDWALLLSIAAAASRMGRPVTAMGNNMAIDRNALDAVGGFRSVAWSLTEDYALLSRLSDRGPVSLALDPAVINWTEPEESLRGIFSQRRRWALGSLDGSLLHVLILATAPAAALGPWILLMLDPLAGSLLLLARWAANAGVLQATARRLGVSLPLGLVPMHELLMTGYAVLVPVSCLFSRRVRWKGRHARQGERVRAEAGTHSVGAAPES